MTVCAWLYRMERRPLSLHSRRPACETKTCGRRYKIRLGGNEAVRNYLRYPLMGKVFKLVGHSKRYLAALEDLRRFSSKGMAAPATGDSTSPSLVQCAGTSNRAIPGGARRVITDMVSSLGGVPGGRDGYDNAVGA